MCFRFWSIETLSKISSCGSCRTHSTLRVTLQTPEKEVGGIGLLADESVGSQRSCNHIRRSSTSSGGHKSNGHSGERNECAGCFANRPVCGNKEEDAEHLIFPT